MPIPARRIAACFPSPGRFRRKQLPSGIASGVVWCALLALLASPPTIIAAENENPAAPAPGVATSPVAANRVIADLQLELVWIKPGTFLMGSPNDEVGRNKAEGPQRSVTLTRGYWLGKTEVTQAQYAAVMGANPSHFKAAGRDAPAEEVSWLDAMEFCRRLTARERDASRLPAGWAFTLPTEAQWEYACRAGTTGAFAGNPDAMAWYENNAGQTTHPVATRQPNAWGLFDMYGNVLEWCYDWYDNYPRGAATDPTGPDAGYFHMARGGSWRTGLFRSAARSGGSPGRRDYTIGFRLALSPARAE